MARGIPSVQPGGYPAVGRLIADGAPTFSFEFFPPRT
ncbi:MAG TPA: 5,10-methylenetetrahydrofolate reductase, partial [Pilimelia sp.]|nr:5,10-methylenetetrahydrofolate reductase [Pilimelia sp.]